MIFVHTCVKKFAYMHVYNNFVCMRGVYVFNDLCEYCYILRMHVLSARSLPGLVLPVKRVSV